MSKAVPWILFLGSAGLTLAAPVSITQTTNSATLASALGGGGVLAITSAVAQDGAAGQFGTYTGYNGGPVTIANGIVLSTGWVTELTPDFNNGVQGGSTTPSTINGLGGSASFSAYATGRVDNFSTSNDAASLLVTFTLSTASQIGFDFIFGSVEFPEFNSQYTDAFFAFVDGTAAANQIVFDGAGRPVQLGRTFTEALTTGDTNTAFGAPHGVLPLTTFTTATLGAGTHTILFEIADVNDDILDSAVFLANFRAMAGVGGTNAAAPEPGTMVLLGTALAGLLVARRRRLG